MQEFNFTVRGDYITKDKDYSFVEGNKGSYEAVFDFDESWGKRAKLCIIENGDYIHTKPVIKGKCTLPPMQVRSCRIGVIGVEIAEGEFSILKSTNMVGIGIGDGAASVESLEDIRGTAAEVWERYLASIEEERAKAEQAKDDAEVAAQNAFESAENAAKDAVDTIKPVLTEITNTAKSAENAAKQAAEDAESAVSGAADSAADRVREELSDFAERAESAAESANEHRQNASESEVNSAKSSEDAKNYAGNAALSENNAKVSEENAAESEEVAKKAMADLLSMINSGDIVLATNGKLPLSAIPATATQEIYTVASEDELTSLVAQRGDLAELIEEIDGERTITKTWQCLGDASVRENWVVWGTSYAVQAGNSTTADNALNANKINNHRIVEMTEEEFSNAVKNDDTYYLVY